MPAELSMTILVVADYQTTVCIVTNLLKQIGYASIDVAASGPAALCKLRGKSYGLVIVDWSLESMPGGEVLTEIRADTRFDRTPALMLAPLSQAAHVIAAMGDGVDGYLFKPFNASTLQAKIEGTLAGPNAPAGGALTRLVDALPPSA